MDTARRIAALAGGLGLLVAAWVSTASPMRTSFNPPSEDPPSDAPGIIVESGRPPGVFEERPALEGVDDDVPAWLVTGIEWTIYLMATAVVLAIVVLVVRAVVAHLRPVVPTIVEHDVAASVLAGAVEQVETLRSGADVGDSVIRAWVRLEEDLQAAGVRRHAARTAAETVTATLSDHDVDEDALIDLATLYRQARFSDHALTEDDRLDAVRSFRRIHDDLRRERRQPGPGTRPRAGAR